MGPVVGGNPPERALPSCSIDDIDQSFTVRRLMSNTIDCQANHLLPPPTYRNIVLAILSELDIGSHCGSDQKRCGLLIF
jgi:hypothetical protein